MQYGNSDDRISCSKIDTILTDVCTEVLRYLINDIIQNVDIYRKLLHARHFSSGSSPVTQFNQLNRQRSNSGSDISNHRRDRLSSFQADQIKPNMTGSFKFKNLREVLEQNKEKFIGNGTDKSFYKCDELQKRILYPKGMPAENLNEFDLSLCVLLLRFLFHWPCEFNNPGQPDNKDESIQADIRRLSLIRNDYGHKPSCRCEGFELPRLNEMGRLGHTNYTEFSVLAKLEFLIKRILINDRHQHAFYGFMAEFDVILGTTFYSERDLIERENANKYKEYKEIVGLLSCWISDINTNLNDLQVHDCTDLIFERSKIVDDKLEKLDHKIDFISQANKKENKQLKRSIIYNSIIQIIQIVLLGIICLGFCDVFLKMAEF